MKRLMTLMLLGLFLLSFCGCQSSEKKAIKQSINETFNPLKSEDTELIASYFTDSVFLENLSKDKLPAEILDVFHLFFQDFSYSVEQITIADDDIHATALLKLKTIDAKSLAKDFAAKSITDHLESHAAPSAVEFGLEDYFFTLQSVLTDNEYDVLDSECTVHLTKVDDQWKVNQDETLADALTGEFITYAADPDLFTPEEIIALHFDMIKSFDTEQLNRFLSLNNLFSSDDEHKYKIAKAMASQILEHLDYEIISSYHDGINATAIVKVTTCDWNSIVKQCSEQVATYTSTSQALADGFSARLAKAYDILLTCISANTASTDSEITLTLINDGTNWKLQMDNAFAEALLGNVDEAIANISQTTQN